MEIKINLQKSFGKLAQREPFILVDEPRPLLTFESDYVLADTIVVFKDDKQERKCHLKNITDGIMLPTEFVHAGVLHINITLLGKGVPVKSWEVEPIIFRELDTGFQGLPAFDEILKRVSALEQYANNNALAVSDLTAVVSEHNAKIADLFAIAEQ